MKVISIDKNNLMFSDEIISIKNKKGSFYDLEVDKSHNFFGNNILSHNSIYSFTGAEPDMIEKLKEKLQAESLPLSICYRCPIKVVKEAQRFVPEIEWAPNAIEGKVETIKLDQLKKEAKPGCFILSRTNAPLIGLALHFISKGVPANIQGRDLSTSLQSLIKRSRCKKIDKFMEWLEKWAAKEIKRLNENQRDTSSILDKVECFKVLAENCKDTKELQSNIDKLFVDGDDYKRIILSSVHRAKGYERDVVYLLNWTFRYNTPEEKRIRYVAITRAKKELYYVNK